MKLLHYARRRADITLTASLYLDDVLLCVSSHTCLSERVPSIPFAPGLYPPLTPRSPSLTLLVEGRGLGPHDVGKGERELGADFASLQSPICFLRCLGLGVGLEMRSSGKHCPTTFGWDDRARRWTIPCREVSHVILFLLSFVIHGSSSPLVLPTR